MNEFLLLIKQEKISSFTLIKRTILTIKQNFGKVMAASFLYGAVMLVFYFFIYFITALTLKLNMLTSGLVLSMVVVLIASFILYFVGCQTMLGVYYTLLGEPNRVDEMVTDKYVRKSVGLSAIISIIFVAVLVSTLISIAKDTFSPLDYFPAKNIFVIIWFSVAAIIMYKGVKLEFLLTEKTLPKSIKKVAKLGFIHLKDLMGKAVAGILLFMFVFGPILLFTLGYFLDMYAANMTGLGDGLSKFSLNSVTSLIICILLYVVLFIEISLIDIFYNVYSMGFYLNLNNRSKNEITGLYDEELNEEQKSTKTLDVEPINNEVLEDKATLNNEVLEEKTTPNSEALENKTTLNNEALENKATLNNEALENKATLNNEALEDKATLNNEALEDKATLNSEALEDKATLNNEVIEDKAEVVEIETPINNEVVVSEATFKEDETKDNEAKAIHTDTIDYEEVAIDSLEQIALTAKSTVQNEQI